MTVLKTMAALTINKKHLSVNEEHFNNGTERNRGRASSLALPHSSLLDFYDKQQEQCNSVALLMPTSVNVTVRRHSSHYYPMLEDKHHHQQQQPLQQKSSSVTSAVPSHFNYTNKANQFHLEASDMESTIVNNEELQLTGPVPATPPPPIPKRTFRGKYAWNAATGGGSVDSPTSVTGTPTKGKQKLSTTGTAFIYPTQGGSEYFVASATPNDSNVRNSSHTRSLYVDIASTRPLYATTDGILSLADAGGISDDDRTSLDNSVFDESLTSTPVKVTSTNSNTSGAPNGGTGKLTNATFAAKTLAALTSDLSNAAKRSNRSSSSTVDSSSGYGSHSERFASTSTTADFRSRFSSVDTQASLDSSAGLIVEKSTVTNDSPLSKDFFKMDRTMLNEVMLEYNNFNNNDMQQHNAHVVTAVAVSATASNNNTFGRQSSMINVVDQKLPTVPVRKQYALPPKIPPPYNNSQQSLHSSGSSSKAPSTVSASTSTSSTASAGSGTSSGGCSSMSFSTTAISPLTNNDTTVIQKRPSVPPAPPRQNNTQSSFDSTGGAIVMPMELTMMTPTKPAPPPLSIRNKLQKHRPPPIVYPKLHQRQDSNLSSDSFSVTSSPGYNSKNIMDAPLLQNAARINKSGPGMGMRHQDSLDSFGMTSSRYVFSSLGNPIAVPPSPRNKINYRQDSTISSDSFSHTSSPGYNTKIMEAPLLPSLSVKRLCGVPAPIVCKQKLQNETIDELEQSTAPMSPLTKCVSTPASLQTIVRFQNGAPNTTSLQHQIINRRKSSNPYVTNGRLKFRLFQVLLNAFALLAIAGGLAAYFNAYPTIKFVNKTIINTIHVEDISKNPAPGTCLPIIVKFCQGPKIPYNYTVFPNYIGHFGQLETQVDLDAYEALVDVRCYELVSLYLCTLFVPKCGATGATVPPCKTLCTETERRCGFFFDVFGLSLPDYLNCNLFKDFASSEDCVGLEQVRDVVIASSSTECTGFKCDKSLCVPKDYVCDGHIDCWDQSDEANCDRCDKDEIYCGEDHCVSSKRWCDGVIDCPYGQDERSCIRLSEHNGDFGKGILEVVNITTKQFSPACVKNWDRAVSPTAVCSMLGYSSVNATNVITKLTNRPLLTSVNVSTDIWKMYAKKRSNLMQEFRNCKPDEDYPIAELTCSNYECGKIKLGRLKPARRIVGGSQVKPGSWPFLAAILGGPEKIFYCAGVLIADQWVLTASHCIGNHTSIDLENWTIQLGVTRRNSYTYSAERVKVKTVIPHPQYNIAIAHDNDIALFQLSRRVAFTEHLSPICLPPPGFKSLKPDQMCTVIGWGKREDKNPKSTYEHVVNEVQVPIIRRQQCDEWLDNLTVSDGMICAGYEEGGKDACQGDSGGPLLCPYPGEKNRWFVGGIVSWGIMCAHPKLPGVYANVIKYVPWILEQMQKYSTPLSKDKFPKFEAHPGGPDILSNVGNTGQVKSKKPHKNQNRSPMDIDSYENYEKSYEQDLITQIH